VLAVKVTTSKKSRVN